MKKALPDESELSEHDSQLQGRGGSIVASSDLSIVVTSIYLHLLLSKDLGIYLSKISYIDKFVSENLTICLS